MLQTAHFALQTSVTDGLIRLAPQVRRSECVRLGLCWRSVTELAGSWFKSALLP